MSARTHSGLSQQEVGNALGISRQAVQIIERRALNKLRIALGSKYRGGWHIFDTEGVPEPASDFRDRSYSKTRSRRSGGRFA